MKKCLWKCWKRVTSLSQISLFSRIPRVSLSNAGTLPFRCCPVDIPISLCASASLPDEGPSLVPPTVPRGFRTNRRQFALTHFAIMSKNRHVRNKFVKHCYSKTFYSKIRKLLTNFYFSALKFVLPVKI